MKLRLLIILCLVSLAATSGVARAQSGDQPTLRNPLNRFRGADPWLVFYEGFYYLAATTGASELTMRKSPTLAGLKTAITVRIYAETDASRCCNIWAPEFHLLDGPNGRRWYFYYSAGTLGTLDNQRTHVLESAGPDPLGPYTYKARLFDPRNDVWAIDGSVLRIRDSLYFLFSSWVGKNQSLFIAPMSNPWTLSGERVLIAEPEYDWERVGLNVTEGPVALQHDGKTFIIYSASFCATPDYKLGMLTYSGGDPLRAAAWVKSPQPVFQRSDANGVFGPGHNGFFQSPDGTQDWIVYHANDSASAGCDDRRTTRVQRFTWNADGTPDFGTPVSTSEVIDAPSGDSGVDPMPTFPLASRFRQFNLKDAYIRHFDTVLKVDFSTGNVTATQFIVSPGLADPAAVSLESFDYPGYFVRHQGNLMALSAHDGSVSFEADATWWIRPGLADKGGISFESFNQPGKYIGQKIGLMALVDIQPTTPDTMLKNATFIEERPK